MPRPFQSWKDKLTSLLGHTEASYDLSPGEALRASHTTEGDLQELFSFGWTAEETARAITETLGLR
ncbi:MAG: hypothetical protein CMJ29_08875 [Phycisphaerae bacterium]|nr:hypothetical protein [Phycisphaerae bacterium]|tara:strand:+ start:282 stop:479 length:198 start_codon:yes stop_codon:yes gene_type:complete